MPVRLPDCSRMLAAEGVRHHFDSEAGVIHVVLASRDYRSRRDERLIVIRLTAPDEGRRCRMTLHRAFTPGGARDTAALCLAVCSLAADAPLIGVEYDASQDDLRLVVETVLEDAELTMLQMLSMLDGIVLAAETWPAALKCPDAPPQREAA